MLDKEYNDLAVLFPQLQFFDNNGAPLALGKVYTYITGTTTPKSTWTTAAESANHPNPVILDDEGRAEIWLSTDSEYRITIKSATDATIQGPIDNVTGVGIQLSSFSELASDLDVNSYALISTNNGDINFTPNGSGDVKATVTSGSIDLDSTTGDINLKTTSGAINIGHKATGPGSLRFLEDTDNGANYVEVIAPASVASNKVQTLQDVTGTIICTGGTDLTVADGGTGVSSLTAYGPVIGGTTTTGPLQAVSPSSSIMQSLFSGGSSAIPAYSYAPKRTVFSSTGGAANLDATITDMVTLGGVNNLVMVHISVRPVTDGSSLYMRFFDSTTTIVTTNYAWQMIEVNGTTVTGAENTSDTKIDLTNGRGTGNSGDEILEGVIWITGASFHGTLRNYLASGAQQSITITGLNNQFFDGIRTYASAGNVSGSISVTNFPVGT